MPLRAFPAPRDATSFTSLQSTVERERSAYVTQYSLRSSVGALAADAQHLGDVRTIACELGAPSAYWREEGVENGLEPSFELDISQATAPVPLFQLADRDRVRIERIEVREDDVPFYTAGVRRAD